MRAPPESEGQGRDARRQGETPPKGATTRLQGRACPGWSGSNDHHGRRPAHRSERLAPALRLEERQGTSLPSIALVFETGQDIAEFGRGEGAIDDPVEVGVA
jgi:hypothetical protein